jgi:hypothetical protein
MRLRNTVFHPLAVLGTSLVAALVFSVFVIKCFDGEMRLFLLFYFMPVGIPFTAYILDRAERWRTVRLTQWAIDLFVLALSLARATAAVPLISGHTLFLIYALLSTQSWVARGTAAVVLLQVSYLKLFIWHDITWLGGMTLGGIAALCFHLLRSK